MSQYVCDLTDLGIAVNKWVGLCFGGRGDVYTALTRDRTRVVIKRLQIDNCPRLSRITEEIQFLRSLRHAHIVVFHSAFVYNDSIFLASNACTYGSVFDIILASYENGVPEKVISIILYEILKALSYVHKQNIIHRSIRASHILIGSDGHARLTGFRCAVRLGKRGSVTDFGPELEGSLLWLAPEVLAQDLNGYGTLSDIYSLGITLCEMANGFPPFTDMEHLEMLYEKGRGTTPKLLDHSTLPALDQSNHAKRELSQSLHHVTELCLRASPINRPHADKLLEHPFPRRRKRGVIEMIPHAKTLDQVARVSESERTPELQTEVPTWNF